VVRTHPHLYVSTPRGPGKLVGPGKKLQIRTGGRRRGKKEAKILQEEVRQYNGQVAQKIIILIQRIRGAAKRNPLHREILLPSTIVEKGGFGTPAEERVYICYCKRRGSKRG